MMLTFCFLFWGCFGIKMGVSDEGRGPSNPTKKLAYWMDFITKIEKALVRFIQRASAPPGLILVNIFYLYFKHLTSKPSPYSTTIIMIIIFNSLVYINLYFLIFRQRNKIGQNAFRFIQLRWFRNRSIFK